MSSRENKKRPVPKFSSFKPKQEPEASSPHGEVEKSRESSRAGHQEHRGGSQNNQSHSRDRQRPVVAASGARSDPHSLVISQRSAAHKGRDGDSLYVVDKRGDALIRRYGSNNRHDVPEYRRIGAGRVLGVDGFMRIDRTGTREEFFIRGHHEGRSVLGGNKRSLLAKRPQAQSVVVRVRKDESPATPGNDDFLPLRPAKRRKRNGDASESSGEEGPSYRSIHGKAKPHEHSESDEEYSTDSSTNSNWRSADDPVTAKSIELSRRVREHPEDIQAWMQLVDHQDVLLDNTSSGIRRPTLAEVKSFADIKLSMLEKALSHAATDSQRMSLHLRIMREGAKIWDPKNLEKRWADVMQKHGSQFEIWLAHMNYRQTTLSTFQYDDIKKLYVERLQFIKAEIAGLPISSNHIPLYEQMIYVFTRASRFIADAGFQELGTALWQATLELTFSRPAAASEVVDGTVPSSFEAFWESEVPRLGEEGAQGWAAFERDANAQEPPEPKSRTQPPVPATRDGYKAWSVYEHHSALAAMLPARTLDDGADEDPYRVVMYGDLQDLLVYFPAHIIPHIRRQLLDAFLVFNQLPPAFASRGSTHDVLQDVFVIRSPTELFVTQRATNGLDVDQNPDEQTKTPDFLHDYQCMARAPDVLFSSPRWFQYMPPIQENIPPDHFRWVLNTLKQLVRSLGVKELAPYYLAFESSNDPGNEKKTAKALLKQDPTNVDLYEGYAILEWMRSNKAAARNVVAAAMGSPGITDNDHYRLGIVRAWMELEDGALARSTLQLCALAEGRTHVVDADAGDEPVTPFQVLKTRNLFAANRDYLLSSGDPEYAVIFAEGLALLEYLTQRSNKEPSSASQGDIWSAIASVSACSEEIVARGLADSAAHERLLQFAARLLYLHANKGTFRPGFLREQLIKYLSFFPHNTIFLSLLAWKETRLGLEDRVRSVLDTTALARGGESSNANRLSSHVFAIRHEAQSGNAHSAQAAFERALLDESCGMSHHPGLWAAYVRFCRRHAALRPKAQAVFYRALQHCPGNKAVLLLAFATDLVRELDSAELRSVYHTLCDKGLRVHVELPEFVERWRREQKAVVEMEREREREREKEKEKGREKERRRGGRGKR